MIHRNPPIKQTPPIIKIILFIIAIIIIICLVVISYKILKSVYKLFNCNNERCYYSNLFYSTKHPEKQII